MNKHCNETLLRVSFDYYGPIIDCNTNVGVIFSNFRSPGKVASDHELEFEFS